MESVRNITCISSSTSPVFLSPVGNNALLTSHKKGYLKMVSNSGRLERYAVYSCKLSEGGIEENNGTNRRVQRSSSNKLEEYNTAMKRMMRNPYEYHHDLGQFR